MEQTSEENVLVLRAIYRLLGAIPPSLRAVSVELKESEIGFLCYFEVGAKDEEIELLECAAAELISDYSAPFVLDDRYIKQPASVPMKHLKSVVFLRHENAT